MCRNEWNLGLNVINDYPIFETIRKMNGYENLNILSSVILPHGNNGINETCLINIIIIILYFFLFKLTHSGLINS